MSKGSGRRPQQAEDEQVKSNWDAIFGVTCKRCGKTRLHKDGVHTCTPKEVKEKANVPDA